jgi:uncharacterized protein (DUF1786 family)
MFNRIKDAYKNLSIRKQAWVVTALILIVTFVIIVLCLLDPKLTPLYILAGIAYYCVRTIHGMVMKGLAKREKGNRR